MRLTLLLGVVLIFIVTMADGIYLKNIINCSSISENLPISEVIPIRYDVKLVVKPRLKILLGYMNILIDVIKTTRYISLHSLSTYGYEVEVEPGHYKLHEFKYCEKKQVLILVFNEKLNVGKFWLKIAYRSILNKNIQNIFYPTAWNNRNQTWMLTNLYTPKAIRALFPCWDDPRVNATYNISIQFPADYIVLSTIPEKSSSSIRDPSITQLGTKFTQYKELISTPIHLIAFLIVDDIMIDFEHGCTNYMWYKANTDKKFSHVLAKAELVICIFIMFMKINSLDIPPKITHVILPNSPMKSMGAPGLVVYRERDITFNEVLDFPGRSVDVTTLVTYEMARQIFLGAVNPYLDADADYIWLNEIFASFYGYYITSKIREADRLTELFVVKFIQPALDSDTLLEREPIIHKAKNSKGIDALLYPLLYHKKAFALIRMLLQLVNPQVFQGAISKYIHERTSDVWTMLEEVHFLKYKSGYTIKEIMNTWLTAKHHPELFIQRDYEMQTAACISSRTFVDGNSQWIIPINYITESTYKSYNISEVLWLRWGQVKNIHDVNNNEFLIVNAEATGYYRVNYDTKNWALILTYLQKHNFSNIPPINRAQLINDAYYFIINNRLETKIFINITNHLKWSTDFVVWYPVFNILSYMSSYFKFSESKRIKEHFLELFDEVLTKIGYEDYLEDDTMRKSLRYLVRKWACKLGHFICRNEAFHRLIYHLDYQENIPEMSKEWILCDGMKVEDLNLWKKFLNKSMNNTEFLKYLSCTENTSIIVHYLTLIIQTNYFYEIEQLMGPICRTVVRKHIKDKTVLHFVLNNFGAIINRFPHDFPLNVLLSDIILNIYSLEDLDVVQEYTNRHPWIMDDLSVSLRVFIRQWKGYLLKILSKFQMFHS